MENLISVHKLTFGYDKNNILENVSFDIKRGSFVGVVGSNGTGKSTLLKILLNILQVKSGSISIMGEDISRFKGWEQVGYVSQKATSVNSGFPATVYELVGANLYPSIKNDRFMLKASTRKTYKEKVERALLQVGITNLRNKQIGRLSGGQQQRVFIARAIVNNPKILLLDEPTTGIDIHAEDNLYCLLKDLNRKMGITVLMVTHDITAIMAHSDRLLALNDSGVSEYDPHELIDDNFFKKIYGYDLSLHAHRRHILL